MLHSRNITSCEHLTNSFSVRDKVGIKNMVRSREGKAHYEVERDVHSHRGYCCEWVQTEGQNLGIVLNTALRVKQYY